MRNKKRKVAALLFCSILASVMLPGSKTEHTTYAARDAKARRSDSLVIADFQNGFYFNTIQTEEGIGIVVQDENGKTVFENRMPVEIRILNEELEESFLLEVGYENIQQEGECWIGKAQLVSPNGSIFTVSDQYEKQENGVRMTRSLKVDQAGEGDKGYCSLVTVESADETAKEYEDYEYLIPSLLYKDSEGLTPAAAFSQSAFESERVMAKETRSGLPFVMMRNKETGATLSLAHDASGISDKVTTEEVQNKKRCDPLCRYGSIGLEDRDIPAAAFCYPYIEAPSSYASGSGSSICCHPIEAGAKQQYSLYLYAAGTSDYNEAMMAFYQENYKANSVPAVHADMEKIYNVVMEDLKDYVMEQGNGIGFPFAAYVDDGSIFIDAGGNVAVNFQMGFIGMQIPLGYQMIRCGMQNGDEEMIEKGVRIVNFWCESCGTDSGVVKVWYDTLIPGFRPYPPFLRIMTDGMEGMLDAYQIAKSRPDANWKAWGAMVRKYADFLVREQNEDGSFYRAYDYSGQAFTDQNQDGLIGDLNTQGSSKANTAVPIRFLVRMYEVTGEEKYLEAAKRAGAYVLENLFVQGKYVGGTADNPNTVDKEAGMYAVYAYSALYEATKDSRYLNAMEQAVTYTMSWAYTYKFSVQNPKNLTAGIPSTLALNDGLSFIAAGHSGIDNMIAYMYYEYFKLYVWTGKEVYYDMALFIQNNTKQTMDLDGKFGYARQSFMIEATNIADMIFGTAGDRGIWLPWISCANIEPISQMEDTFGVKDIETAGKQSLENLRTSLEAYGAGGNKE